MVLAMKTVLRAGHTGLSVAISSFRRRLSKPGSVVVVVVDVVVEDVVVVVVAATQTGAHVTVRSGDEHKGDP